jgi:hypothetical protein
LRGLPRVIFFLLYDRARCFRPMVAVLAGIVPHPIF